MKTKGKRAGGMNKIEMTKEKAMKGSRATAVKKEGHTVTVRSCVESVVLVGGRWLAGISSAGQLPGDRLAHMGQHLGSPC